LLFDLLAGRTLTKEGARGREFFALAEGQADMTKKDRKVALSDGDFFCEIALLTKMPRNDTVTSTTPSGCSSSPMATSSVCCSNSRGSSAACSTRSLRASRSTRPGRFSRSARGRRLARR
jgi:hypothetical protein